MSDPLLPATIGRYRVEAHAGSGAFASVYRCIDERLDSVVAVKLLADNWRFDPDVLRRFRDEAVLLRRLADNDRTHALVNVFDIDQQDTGQPFFVMEWAEGGTLAARVGRGDWSVEQVRPVVHALARGMGHLHDNAVVHRDIKPSNLLIFGAGTRPSGELLAQDERLALADLGLAKDLNDDLSNLSLVTGTERFAAPEQLDRSATVGFTADIYSATAVVRSLVGNNTAASQQLAPFLRQSLSDDPADRPQTATEWAALFDEAPQSQTQPGSSAAASTPGASGAWRGRPSMALLVASLLAAAATVGVAGFLWSGSSRSLIAGPAQIESGQQAQYRLEGSQGSLPWVLPDGSVDLTASLLITGRLPGELAISVPFNGEIHRRTIEVMPSPLGPVIEGPDRVDRGRSSTWTVVTEPGDRIQWSTSTGEVGSGSSFDFTADEDFVLQVFAIDDSGVERADQLKVSVG